MESRGTQTRLIQELLNRLQAGDDSARDTLIEQACDRLRRLTRKLKRDSSSTANDLQTQDSFVNEEVEALLG